VALASGGVVFSVDDAAGDVEVAVYPWDVSIARERSRDSALNHVEGPITSLVRLGNRARVQIRGGLVAEVTAASADRLGLVEGELVVASFKAAATRLVERAARPDAR
jgi:molybdopterin-binding protein